MEQVQEDMRSKCERRIAELERKSAGKEEGSRKRAQKLVEQQCVLHQAVARLRGKRRQHRAMGVAGVAGGVAGCDVGVEADVRSPSAPEKHQAFTFIVHPPSMARADSF